MLGQEANKLKVPGKRQSPHHSSVTTSALCSPCKLTASPGELLLLEPPGPLPAPKLPYRTSTMWLSSHPAQGCFPHHSNQGLITSSAPCDMVLLLLLLFPPPPSPQQNFKIFEKKDSLISDLQRIQGKLETSIIHFH